MSLPYFLLDSGLHAQITRLGQFLSNPQLLPGKCATDTTLEIYPE